MLLQKKTMLVIGGAGGIGQAIVEQALAAGAEVIVWDKDITPLAGAGLADRVKALELDACSEAAVRDGFAALEQEKKLPDILVNAAGVFINLKPMGVLDLAGFQAVMQTNVTACFATCSEALRRYRDKLTIVNISSALGKRPIPMAAAYCASKAAIDSLTRSIAFEYGAKGVRANCVSPGPVEGSLLQKGIAEIAAGLGAPTEAIMGKILEGIPQGRVLTSGEVAELVIFLAADQAQGITGQAVNICGGYDFS